MKKITLAMTLTAALILVCGGAATPSLASTVNLGTLTPFTGGEAGEGLDLTGNIIYAFNLGGSAQTVQGVTFAAAAVGSPPVGITTTAGNQFDYSGANPGGANGAEYGSHADDDALETIVNTVWYDTSWTFDLAVTPGAQYKLQLILQESFWTFQGGTPRNFDISVEIASPSTLTLAVDELVLGMETDGAAPAQPGADQGLVYTYTFTATDSSFRVALDDSAAGADLNSILGAVILEELPLLVDFNTEPNLDTEWTEYVYFTGDLVTPTWNSTDEDLDLVKTHGGGGVGLYRTGITRAATDSSILTALTVKELGRTSGTWGFLGLMVSVIPQPGYITTGDDTYTLRMQPTGPAAPTTFTFQVTRTYLDGTVDYVLHQSLSPITFSGPYVLDIKRVGDHYAFRVNRETLYTTTGIAPDFYGTAVKDSMVYYEIVMVGDGAMTATVDNFGVRPLQGTLFIIR